MLKATRGRKQITFMEKKLDCLLPSIKIIETKTQQKHILKLLNDNN